MRTTTDERSIELADQSSDGQPAGVICPNPLGISSPETPSYLLSLARLPRLLLLLLLGANVALLLTSLPCSLTAAGSSSNGQLASDINSHTHIGVSH